MNSNTSVIRMCYLTALTAYVFVAFGNASFGAERANILFIFTDDHALKSISSYGGPLAKIAPTPTPRSDCLTKECSFGTAWSRIRFVLQVARSC